MTSHPFISQSKSEAARTHAHVCFLFKIEMRSNDMAITAEMSRVERV